MKRVKVFITDDRQMLSFDGADEVEIDGATAIIYGEDGGQIGGVPTHQIAYWRIEEIKD